MNEILSYGGITTKIRAMEGHFLTVKDFQELVSFENVPAVASFLKRQPGYAAALDGINETSLHRGQLEACVGDTIFMDFEKLYRFSDSTQRRILRGYWRRFEVRLLKGICSTAMRGEIHPPHSAARAAIYRKYCSFDYDRAMASDSLGSLTEDLRGTLYYEALRQAGIREDAQLFDYETALDLALFSAIWKELGEEKNNEIREIETNFYGTKFDMLNLWYIYRAKHYFNMSNVDIYALTIPDLYRLKKKDITDLVESETPESFRQVLRNTYYGKHIPDLVPENLQYMYTMTVRNVIRKEAQKKPYSIASLYSYLYWKEHELYRLTTATECVRYRMDPHEAIKIVLRR